ncbi:MFS transporter [Sulfobacillus thermosulfidooxidans]|uniref:MFS transporter n=1 Tax=Sulfobacillus thermosulfidooxidans TaxID=28034 RepID=UPI0006B603B4|nr:MFS transporter [Sulfobacillus thermosulfidooxidans]
MIINSQFSRLFFASVINVLGSNLTYIAIYWVYSKEIGVTYLAVLIALTYFSRFVFNLLLGPVADHIESKQLMQTMIFARGCLLLAFGLLITLVHISLLWLILMSMILVALGVMYELASTKLILDIVEEKDLSRANALISLVYQFGSMIGLALGGVMASFLRIGHILFFESFGYFIGFGLLWSLRIKNDNVATIRKTGFIANWIEGISFVLRHKWLFAVLGLALFSNIAITPTITLEAPYALDVLHGGAQQYAYLEIAVTGGGILCGLVFSKLRIAGSLLPLYLGVATVSESVFMVVFGLSGYIYYSVIALIFVGGAISLFNIPFTTILQQYTPKDKLGACVPF